MSLQVKNLFDPLTYTHSYLVYDNETKDAIIIDPVLDYDQASSQYSFESIEKILGFVSNHKLNVHYILETHAHADHLSGAQILKRKLPGSLVGIGKNITKVQEVFKEIFNIENLKTDASQFDILLNEEQEIKAGSIKIKTLFTPGHTPACSSYLIEDMVFVGDAIFMPDYGTGRCDFPEGSAHQMYNSIANKLYQLPDETRVFTGHDYGPGGREILFESTIGEQKKQNIQLKNETSEKEYIEFRTKRDSILSAPKLLLPSIQVNINAGHLPEKDNNQMSYLKIPISEKKI